MIRLLLDAGTAMNVRFVISPATETEHLVRLISRHPEPDKAPEPWIREAAQRLSALDVGELVEIVSGDYSWPSFLTPIPTTAVKGDLFEWQLAAAADTPLGEVERQIDWSFEGRKIPAGPLHSAHQARSLLTEQLSRAYHAMVAPMWQRVEAVLRTDLAVRSHQASEGGLAAVVNALHPRFRLDGTAIEYTSIWDGEVEVPVENQGLVLVPTVFDRQPAIDDEPAQGPMQIIYPARGSALLFELDETHSDSALTEVLGTTRVAILASASEPITTTDLAARLDMAPGTVSLHLTTMTAVGWLHRTRVGRRVYYELSPLGKVILNRSIDSVTKSA